MTGLLVLFAVFIHFSILPVHREKEVEGERLEVNRSPAWGKVLVKERIRVNCAPPQGKGVSKGTNKV